MSRLKSSAASHLLVIEYLESIANGDIVQLSLRSAQNISPLVSGEACRGQETPSS